MNRIADDFEAIAKRMEELKNKEIQPASITCVRCNMYMKDYGTAWVCTHCSSTIRKDT